jgi:hypothetical protein
VIYKYKYEKISAAMMEAKTKDRIKILLDEYLRLLHSGRNEKLKKYWKEKPSGFAVNLFRPDEAKSFMETGSIPVVVNPCETIFAYLYGYSLKDYYTDPEVYLEMYLRQRIDQFKTIGDDSCLRVEIPIWLGSYYEHSFFGVTSIYSDDETPRPEFQVVIGSRNDLERFQSIDFARTGHGPLAIEFYEVISEYVAGSGLCVTMPYFNRGPFGVLSILMGFDKLYLNAYDDPDFIMDAMHLVNEVSIDYERWINKEYGSPLGPKAIYNDDVSCPILSPDFYKRFVFPAEKALEKTYGGFSYWHSCGNCDELLPIIRDLSIESMNVSMVGDLDKYTKTFQNNASYEICVHPIDEVLKASPTKISEKLDSILSVCDANGVEAFSIVASALEGTGRENIISDLKQIFLWLEIATEKVNAYITKKRPGK